MAGAERRVHVSPVLFLTWLAARTGGQNVVGLRKENYG